MKKIVIAIDGYSACGKSTTAKAVASKLGYLYLDSGAMYRAVTLYFDQHYININNSKEVDKALEDIHITFILNPKLMYNETYLNGLNVEEEIRKMYISERVSEVSALPQVRKALVAQQRKLGRKKGVVMDGRDIGTVVFPEAELKIFMLADFQIRAERRQKELLEKDQLLNLEEVKENLRKRDFLDTTRQESPLKKAEDAYIIDTTFITIEEQVEEIIKLATSKMIEIEKIKNSV
jgi:CMP/dCMP kinase